MTENQDLLSRAAEIVRAGRHVVAFTGAGMSVPSGIPDFRSADTGLWNRFDPMQVASLTAFRYHPERFFNWLRPLAASIQSARPNAAHSALARLEEAGVVKAIITQNIDALHQRGGSKRVLEIHGSLETMLCPRCRRSFPAAEHWDGLIAEGTFPRCPNDGETLKPGITLYEEMLPEDIWRQAEAEALSADVMLVIGSSLEVGPANMLPAYAVSNGAALIINTRSSTPLDEQASILLREDLAQVVPALAEQVLGRSPHANPS
jgi:NAD-dependent deacetylase